MTTYTTRNDAITHEITGPLGDHADQHDIDAIADEVLTTTGEGTTYRFQLRDDLDHDAFWEIVAKHDLTADITAELVDINRRVSGRSLDYVRIARNDVEITTVAVESTDDPAPYDKAVSEAIDGADFTWLPDGF